MLRLGKRFIEIVFGAIVVVVVVFGGDYVAYTHNIDWDRGGDVVCDHGLPDPSLRDWALHFLLGVNVCPSEGSQ